MREMFAERDRVALCGFLDAKLGARHQFDGNCCVRFVLGGVKAQFGAAPRLPVRWRTARGAKRAIVRLGGFERAVETIFDEIPICAAQFGDIAGVIDGTIDPVTGFHVMLVEGRTLCSPGDRGLERVPRSAMVRAWSAAPPWGKIAVRRRG